jgi:hypothetical protein
MLPPLPFSVLDNNLTPTEVDMIFVRSKSKGERRIKFREFVDAVHKMAAAKVGGVWELWERRAAALFLLPPSRPPLKHPSPTPTPHTLSPPPDVHV